MLSLQLKSGDYLTIGEDVVVQVFKGTGSQFRVSVKAPRQVPILRGEIRERSGDRRPQGLLEHPPKKSPSTQAPRRPPAGKAGPAHRRPPPGRPGPGGCRGPDAHHPHHPL